MRIIVTGAKGLLGSACVRVLGETHEVHKVFVDLRDYERSYDSMAVAAARADAIIHCAAKVGGVKSNRDLPVDFIQNNILINHNVIRLAHELGIKNLVNIGTSCMFPKDSITPVSELSYMTGPLEESVRAYAMAKIAAYETCRAYNTQYGTRYTTVCPANIYGLNDNYSESAHVIPALIAKAYRAKQSGVDLKVWGDGSAVREFIYADDVATAIKAILEVDSLNHDIYNVGTGVGTSIETIAYGIASIFDIDRVVFDPTEPTGIQNKTFDISRISALGWKPSYSLGQGLTKTIEEYKITNGKRK